MNAKTAKRLRAIARAAALKAEDAYLMNTRSGAIRLGKCDKGFYRKLKQLVSTGKSAAPTAEQTRRLCAAAALQKLGLTAQSEGTPA